MKFYPNSSSGSFGPAKTYTAQGSVSALKVVTATATGVAREATVSDRDPLGLALTAADDGTKVTVLLEGEHSDSNWSWTPGGALFIGPNGSLTQTPPLTGIRVRMGSALTATTVLIRPSEPILLA